MDVSKLEHKNCPKRWINLAKFYHENDKMGSLDESMRELFEYILKNILKIEMEDN